MQQQQQTESTHSAHLCQVPILHFVESHRLYAANQFESRFDDDLLVSYLDKGYNTFWKLWKNKVQTKRTNVNTSQIGGKCDDQRVLLMLLPITAITLSVIIVLITTHIFLTSVLRILLIGCLAQMM